jgi:hypothetical protein
MFGLLCLEVCSLVSLNDLTSVTMLSAGSSGAYLKVDLRVGSRSLIFFPDKEAGA